MLDDRLRMKQRSPCKDCASYPCKKHKDCEDRIAYYESFRGKDLLKAVDSAGDDYRLISM